MRNDKQSASIVITGDKNEFLIVKRSMGDSFSGHWGFPAASVRGDETLEEVALRAARDKLGVEIEITKVIGERTENKGEYNEHQTEFEARILSGEISLKERDSSVSKYDEFKYTSNPKELLPAAKDGSICSRIFLESHGIKW